LNPKQVEQLRATKAEMERQFNRLYHTKYLPLKAEAGPLRQEAAALRAQLTQEEARVRMCCLWVAAAGEGGGGGVGGSLST
jgi:hypothetical protein